MIKQFDFGQEAISFIRQELSYGKSLAEHIRRSIDLDAGHVIAYLPEETRTDQRLNFQYGGLITTPESRQETANFVLKFLKESSDSYVIVEEEIATLDNQTGIQQSDEQFFVFEAEIYSFLTSYIVLLNDLWIGGIPSKFNGIKSEMMEELKETLFNGGKSLVPSEVFAEIIFALKPNVFDRILVRGIGRKQ